MVTPSDRRRIVLASVVTALAMPWLIRENVRHRDASSAAAAPAVAGANVGERLTGTDPTSTVSESSTATDAGNEREGKAIFRIYEYRDVYGDQPCSSPDLPVGTVVHIENLNNGRTTDCTVASTIDQAALGKDRVILLDSTVFKQIADPAVGVIPVRLTW